MKMNYKAPLALGLLSLALVGCSNKTIKVAEQKPSPLPKISASSSIVAIANYSVAATNKIDPLRLQLGLDQGQIFAADPKGEVTAYQGKQRVWQSKISKAGISAGAVAGEGIVVVANKKGQLFALDQATGQTKWQSQLSSAVLAPSLIQAGRVITLANDGTVFAHDISTGQQIWTYNLPKVDFSMRGTAAPVAVDPRTVLVAWANSYVYVIDTVTGIPQLQRRVSINDGRSDIQRLNDIDGEPVVAGRYLISTSYQGQLTAMDLASQQVIWSEDASSLRSPVIFDNKVFVAQSSGQLTAYDITTGQQLWQNEQLLNRRLSNPAVLGNQLVVGDLDGVLHLVDPNSGNLIGRAKTSGEVRSLRTIDQQLYVSSQKGTYSIWQNR
ncbi:outer membrane protein assembly factor BamB [uncultured Acinetobacter sp.]|uniref:outer membrane protein assembly factor BamB n=1 Tax=uncultured Acinetobacter sp. TaxID=165433 RepID=UPI0026273AFE|nr:outer membrane protein assembly factor BamB [uncultured Acinetobacter sp.]